MSLSASTPHLEPFVGPYRPGWSLTRADMEWLVTQDAVKGRDYEVSRVTEFWRLTAEQDWKLCEDNQAGINSSRYQPGPYTPVESVVAHFVEWHREALAKP